jgi:hypothetical protein
MKTTFLSSILTIGLLSVSTIVSAQLKVSDTGKVSIGGLNPKSNCTLTFGNPSGYTTGRYLMLSSDSYSGTFTILNGVHVIFDAPIVNFESGFTCPAGASFETRNEGCEL